MERAANMGTIVLTGGNRKAVRPAKGGAQGIFVVCSREYFFTGSTYRVKVRPENIFVC